MAGSGQVGEERPNKSAENVRAKFGLNAANARGRSFSWRQRSARRAKFGIGRAWKSTGMDVRRWSRRTLAISGRRRAIQPLPKRPTSPLRCMALLFAVRGHAWFGPEHPTDAIQYSEQAVEHSSNERTFIQHMNRPSRSRKVKSHATNLSTASEINIAAMQARTNQQSQITRRTSQSGMPKRAPTSQIGIGAMASTRNGVANAGQ